MRPPIHVVAALVEARRNRGRVDFYGSHGKGAWDALRLGLVEDVGGVGELNLRGMDVADEAIALGKRR